MSTSTAPAMTPVELLRWGWRQLTSMRTALLLLLLLAERLYEKQQRLIGRTR